MSDLTNETLSEREIEILRLVATGVSNKEIATHLVISPNTVKVHLRNIFTKIGVVSRTEATLYALKNGLIDPSFMPKTEPTQPVHVEAEPSLLGQAEPILMEQPAPKRRPLLVAGLAALIVIGLLALGATAWTLLRPRTPPAATPVPTAAQPVTLPVQSRWAGEPELPEARRDMAAVVYENEIYLFGGQTSAGVSAAAVRYDPLNKAWETLADKPTAVSHAQGALLGEKVYVPGGQAADGKPIAALEVYDLRQDQWDTLAPLPVPLSRYGLAAYEGNLYLVGGWDGETYSSAVYRYDPETDAWSERSPLPGPLGGCGVAALPGKLLVIGGFDGTQALTQTLAYFPNRDNSGDDPWEERPALPEARYNLSVVTLANAAYVIGGQQGDLAPLMLVDEAAAWTTFDMPPQTGGRGRSGGGSGQLHSHFWRSAVRNFEPRAPGLSSLVFDCHPLSRFGKLGTFYRSNLPIANPLAEARRRSALRWPWKSGGSRRIHGWPRAARGAGLSKRCGAGW